ncbi:MAG: DUF2007 domain-containing protein, partial [Dongiaceae bacterium]
MLDAPPLTGEHRSPLPPVKSNCRRCGHCPTTNTGRPPDLRELLRTNNPVQLSRLVALLAEDGIEAFVFDQHASGVLGGLVDA